MMKSFLRVCLHDQKYDILYLNLKKIVLDLVGPDLNGFIDLMTEQFQNPYKYEFKLEIF